MYNRQIESLIKAALADGVITDKEREILYKKADEAGIDRDEFDMVLDARLVEAQNEEETRQMKAANKRLKAERESQAERTKQEKLEWEKQKAEEMRLAGEKEEAKSQKHGKMRKCPACGALVPAVAGVCPECGYEFSGVEANATVSKLFDKLEEANDSQKANIIAMMPIPKTKDDLFEFIILMKSQCENTDIAMTINQNDKDQVSRQIDLCKAYMGKHKECIMKAKLLFPNDAMLTQLISDSQEFYKVTNKRIKKAKFLSSYGLLLIAGGIFGGIIAASIIAGLMQ